MPKLPAYISFLEPIIIAILLSLLPEFEYFVFPGESKYSGPMLYMSLVIWVISAIVTISPITYLVKNDFNLKQAAQNYWLMRLGKRNLKVDSRILVAGYKFPTFKQFVFPLVIIFLGVAWLAYPLLLNENYFYPYAIFPILLGLKIISTVIKYNNIHPHGM